MKYMITNSADLSMEVSSIDCAFYSEIQDMNKTVPCCDIYGFGNCKCFGCLKYVSKDDRVVVVRCKDCEFYDKERKAGLKEYGYCEVYRGYKKADGFCDIGLCAVKKEGYIYRIAEIPKDRQ